MYFKQTLLLLSVYYSIALLLYNLLPQTHVFLINNWFKSSSSQIDQYRLSRYVTKASLSINDSRRIHTMSQKQDIKLLFISSPNIDRFLNLFHCYTEQEICDKKVITDPNTPERYRYTTLQNISLQKITLTESTATADRACAYWRECDRNKWAGTKPIRPATTPSFNTLNSTTWCRYGSFFHCDLGLKCLKRRLLENW